MISKLPAGRAIPAFIIAFWLTMTGLLIWREVMVPALGEDAVLAYTETHRDAWMGIYVGDTCLGILNTQIRPDTRDGEYGQWLKIWAQLNVTVVSFPAKLRLNGTAWAPRGGGVSEFEFSISSGDHEMAVEATIEDGVIDGTITTAGEDISLRVPVGENVLFAGNMGTASLNVPDLEKGDEIFVDTFDPISMSVTKAKITCVGEETINYGGEDVPARVFVTRLSAFESKAWVSEDNEVLRAETPFGFTLKKITQKEALAALRPAENEDFVGMLAIKPTGKQPARGAEYMRIRISGLGEDIRPPVDDTQFKGGMREYVIDVPDEPVRKEGPALDDEALAEYLETDPFVQSDHPKIIALANEIVGDEKDVWKKAVLIYGWLYENINKTIVMSLPSALDVLKTREGDCNEHTVLFTGLARAAGIPARIAIGLVWSDDLKGFYYHAWPEVYVGRWTWLDPTLGQLPADATHIKLVTGSIDKWTQLLSYLGQLEIEVLDIHGKPTLKKAGVSGQDTDRN